MLLFCLGNEARAAEGGRPAPIDGLRAPCKAEAPQWWVAAGSASICTMGQTWHHVQALGPWALVKTREGLDSSHSAGC